MSQSAALVTLLLLTQQTTLLLLGQRPQTLSNWPFLDSNATYELITIYGL